MMIEFVKNWDVVQILGEGAYGEVKLLENSITHEVVAVKVLDLRNSPDAESNIRKEICVNMRLNDPHIIKFFGQRRDEHLQYIFLEYASGGELFDRIEPDVGMPHANAHKFFCQLIAGVGYLHKQGIAHRDIKPENLLLDDQDNLKLSDFGMATIFRFRGVERKLNKKCGSIPYVAPEVMIREYDAQPADLWSCGIVLVALLAGELPWDMPTYNCQEYKDWKDCKITKSPWKKIDNLAISLLRRILMPKVSQRFTIEKIKSHQWFTKSFKTRCSFTRTNSNSNDSFSTPVKRFRSGVIGTPGSADDSRYHHFSASQPVPHLDYNSNEEHAPNKGVDAVAEGVCFSQPVRPEHMLLCSQLQATPNSATQGPLQRLVKRMTRFFIHLSADKTVKQLKSCFEKCGYSWKINSPGQITVTTQDRRKMQLIFKASVIEMNDNILVDFRLSRGDGIEFKRQFLRIQRYLANFIIKGLVSWPVAMATNSLP